MKKKILCALLVSSMLLGMTACSTTSANKEESNSSAQATAEKDNKESAATTTPAEPAAEPAQTEPAPETEVEQPEELPVINDYQMIDGCMIFTADGTDYIYNIADNKMYPTELTKIEGRVIKSIRGKVVLIATNKGSEPEYYNLETGEFIGKTFSDNCYTVCEYNPVYTYEESFDWAGYNFGVVNSQGEWVVPLSNEYSICKNDLSNCQMYSSNNMVTRFYENRNYHFYDLINDKFIELPGICYMLYGNKALCLVLDELNVYDLTTGTSTTVLTNVDIEDSQLTTNDELLFKNRKDGSWNFVDFEFNISELPLSEYNIGTIKTVTQDYIAFSAKNSAGTKYGIITDRNGNRIMEPLERASIHISGDYASIADKEDWYILNLKTGEQTPVDIEVINTSFDEASGKMILKTDSGCYLATFDDPNTLINPFEICE